MSRLIHFLHFVFKVLPVEVVFSLIACVLAACFLLPVLKFLFKPISWLLNMQQEDLDSTEQEDSENAQKQFSPLVKFIAIFVYGYLWVKQLLQRFTSSSTDKEEKSSDYNKTYRY